MNRPFWCFFSIYALIKEAALLPFSFRLIGSQIGQFISKGRIKSFAMKAPNLSICFASWKWRKRQKTRTEGTPRRCRWQHSNFQIQGYETLVRGCRKIVSKLTSNRIAKSGVKTWFNNTSKSRTTISQDVQTWFREFLIQCQYHGYSTPSNISLYSR